MLQLLFRVLLFLSGLWVLRRLLSGLFGGVQRQTGPNPAQARKAPTSDTVKDPVCGMYMDPRLAIRQEFKNGSFYFCSDECRQKFLAKPF